jgi:riboflavin transporter FmnP
MSTTTILAAGEAIEGVNLFWKTGIGQTIGMVMGIVAVLILLAAFGKSVKDFTGGKPQAAVKTILGAGLVAAIMFNPELITSLIQMLGDVVKSVLDGGSEVVKEGSSAGQ